MLGAISCGEPPQTEASYARSYLLAGMLGHHSDSGNKFDIFCFSSPQAKQEETEWITMKASCLLPMVTLVTPERFQCCNASPLSCVARAFVSVVDALSSPSCVAVPYRCQEIAPSTYHAKR